MLGAHDDVEHGVSMRVVDCAVDAVNGYVDVADVYWTGRSDAIVDRPPTGGEVVR